MFARTLALTLLLAGCATPAAQTPNAAAQQTAWAAQCADGSGWDDPGPPFKVYGNTYYVGTAGLTAILVTSDEGHILLDAGLPQSAAVIDANIRTLGFRTEDVRLIVNSHAHFDHAGGIAALQRVSGAAVAASAAGKRAIEQGEPTRDDPQYAFGREANRFPAVASVRAVADGETLRAGDLAITAHLTPGHTPGSTTWTWRACEGTRCYDVVYADSLNSVSAPDFRFSGGGAPSLVEVFRKSMAKVESLPCDIIISVHPSGTDMDAKVKGRRERPARDPFVTPDGCRAYANAARARFDARLAEEGKSKAPSPR